MVKTEHYSNICIDNDSQVAIAGKGLNTIPPPEREPLWKGFFRKFTDPMIVVLLVVFFFSMIVSSYEVYNGASYSSFIEPLGVLAALLLATGVGFWFEVKAAREFDVLNQVKNLRRVKVIRKVDGRCTLLTIEKHDIIVGDIVVLESGDEIPADGKVLEAKNLKVDESNFTGEVFADKSVDLGDGQKDAAYPCNQLLRNSTVIEGSCVMLVERIGVDTEEGKGVQLASEDSDVKTPLNQQLDHLGKLLSYGAFTVGGLIVMGRMSFFFLTVDFTWIHFFETLLNSIMIAVALIVMAVPEGLPMSVTMSLALSMRRMLKENNLVRRLHACETMGAATVICTDKTGTLTQNKMQVMDYHLFGNADIKLMARAISVNSSASLNGSSVIGNPTEGALLKWIVGEGFDYEAIRKEVTETDVKPFSSETKYMQTTLSTGEVFVKGAPEMVMGMVQGVQGVQEILEDWQSRGMRTIGFAYSNADTEDKLTFAGIVAIADPVREDVPEAIYTCSQKAGVRVIMVTGDNKLTAMEIGRQSGLVKDDQTAIALTGEEFGRLSDAEARKLIASPEFKILSRARPEDKARLVTLLQQNGEVVAVTGDGTNDAPALKKAQVGLSMGDGTARAKEASDITIIDNSFASINTAILWGRSLYLNIRRFIIYQMTINVTACIVVLFGAMRGLESPLNVTQMLWVNLIMDTFAAMAMSSLPEDGRVMNDKPRSRDSQIIDKTMWQIISGTGIALAVVMIVLWQQMTVHDPHELGLFFTFFVMLQVWNIFNARYFRTGRSLCKDLWNVAKGRVHWGVYYSQSFLLVLVMIVVGQILIVNVFSQMFGVSALSLCEWLMLIVCSSPVLIIGEVWRFLEEKK